MTDNDSQDSEVKSKVPDPGRRKVTGVLLLGRVAVA